MQVLSLVWEDPLEEEMATYSSIHAWEIPWTEEPTVFSSVQFSLSVVSNSSQPHEPQHASPPCPSPIPEFTQTHVHWVSDAIQPFHPLSSSSPPALNLSQYQGLFKWISSLHQVAEVLEFQLQHQSFQWTLRMISFRMDWLDLIAVQGIPKSLLQHCSSKASILWCSAFFSILRATCGHQNNLHLPENEEKFSEVNLPNMYRTCMLKIMWLYNGNERNKRCKWVELYHVYGLGDST